MSKADLVLEGGGVRGIGLVGAFSVLEAHNYSFERVAGTSAGAIVASAIAAGVRSDAMYAALKEIGPSFLDRTATARIPILGDPLSFALRYGMYKGDYFRKWLAKLLREARFGPGARRDVVFGDLRREPQPGDDLTRPEIERSYKLVVMVADVTNGLLVRLPWDYERLYGLDPDKQRVADAVRASMSIPFFFVPVHPAPKKAVFVDGGILSNFPIDVFDRRDGKKPRWPTIGIKLTASPMANQVPIPIGGAPGFIERLVLAMINGHDRMHLNDPRVIARTIFIDTNDVSPINFKLSAGEKTLLFERGKRAAEKSLATQPHASAWTG